MRHGGTRRALSALALALTATLGVGVSSAAAEAYGDCDCPICQMMREEIENAESDEAPGHFWNYFPDSCLLDRYDPEGSEERWRQELAEMQEWQVERQAEHAQAQDAAPGYAPVPLSGQEVDAATFLSVLQRPWLDPELHRAAQQLVDHCDVPLTSATGGLSYRRITLAEALSLIAGLNGQGVDAKALLAQIDAWPYQNVASGPRESRYRSDGAGDGRFDAFR